VETELQALLTKPNLVPASVPEPDLTSGPATSEFGLVREGHTHTTPLAELEKAL